MYKWKELYGTVRTTKLYISEEASYGMQIELLRSP
jgi:hypothetical protein